MNSKIRALMWEEIRVGGSIVAVFQVVGALLMLSLRMNGMFPDWNRASENGLFLVFGIPLLCTLLLVLNVRNSGHMGGGFSQRILRLPVPTSVAVTVTFIVRLVEILALSVGMIVLCWLAYGHRPGWEAALLIVGLYAFIQVLDWMRSVVPMPLVLLAGAGVAWALELTGLWEWQGSLLSIRFAASSPVLAVWMALAFGVSFPLVGLTRRGERVTLWQWGATENAATDSGGESRELPPFSSIRAAHFWYHLRQERLLLPKMTAVFWVLGVLLHWLIEGFLLPSSTNNHGTKWMLSPNTLTIATQLMPFLALLCAAGGWRFMVGMAERWKGRRSTTWTARLPLLRADAARTRMAVAGVHLAGTLFAVTAVYLVSYAVVFFLQTDHFLLTSLFWPSLANGEASVREVVMALLGPAVVFGLLAWIIMCLPGRLVALYLAMTAALLLAGMCTDTLDYYFYGYQKIWIHANGWEVHGQRVFGTAFDSFLPPIAVWFVGITPSVMLAVHLSILGWLGWIGRRSVLTCLAAWAGVTLAFYPFSWSLPAELRPLAVGYCAGIAALAVSCWPEMVLASAGGLRAALHRENPAAQHVRQTERQLPGLRGKWAVVMVALLLAAAWLRWPAAPKVISAMHAQGLPATLEELDDWYAPVPKEENLALKYLRVADLGNRHMAAWSIQHKNGAEEMQALKDRKGASHWGNVLIQGQAKVERTELIPAAVWAATKGYAAAVTETVTPQLHAAAQSGLTRSRYPIDLREGFSTPLYHLATLRSLARELAIEAELAAVERRPDDAVRAIVDTLPLADSLSGEPILISQLVRMAIQGIVLSSVETVMNRTELSGDMLALLQEKLAQSLPPLQAGPFLSRSMVGEAVIGLSFRKNFAGMLAQRYEERPEYTEKEALKTVLLSMGCDLSGEDRMESMVIQRAYRTMRDEARRAAQNGAMPDMSRTFAPLLEGFAYHAPLSAVMLPALDRAYESEWRIRTQLDAACTALAVERYRLANGRLPERLDELVPALLERVAADPWNGGKPLSYRVKENGEFVLYSFGMNKTDEKGEEMESWWQKGDITFTVAPVEVRRRPQVADAPVAGV